MPGFQPGLTCICLNARVLIEHLPPEKFARAGKEFKVYPDKAGIVWDEPNIPAA